jgi:glycerol-3-phosphate dehydrogenase
VKSKVVVNCTGTFSDTLRQLNDPSAKKKTLSARGTHLVLEGGLLPDYHGILIPDTEDGRLVFMLPYHGYTLIGTTDETDEPSHTPLPEKEEIAFLKREAR